MRKSKVKMIKRLVKDHLGEDPQIELLRKAERVALKQYSKLEGKDRQEFLDLLKD